MKTELVRGSTTFISLQSLDGALAKRSEGPPSLRISVVPSCRPHVPPFLNVFSDEVGQRLANFAKFRDVPFEFNVIEDLPILIPLMIIMIFLAFTMICS